MKRAAGIAMITTLLALLVSCDASTGTHAVASSGSPTPPAGAETSVAPAASLEPSSPTTAGVTPAFALVVWPKYRIPAYTTAGGADLAVPGRSSPRVLHAVVSNLEEAWPGYRDASVYARSDDGGQTWRQRVMLGGLSPSVAAAGRHAYLAYQAYACGEGIGVQRSAHRGTKGTWSPVACLSRDGDGISWSAPSIRSVGRHVYVSATEGHRHIASLWVSHDHGRTWLHTRLRTRDKPLSEVRVAARGALVVAEWNEGRSAFARISTDHGRHWKSRVLVHPGVVVDVAASGSRLAISGVDHLVPWLSTWSHGAWVNVAIPDADPGTAIDWPEYRIALRGEDRIGLLYDACGGPEPPSTVWVTSADGGKTWDEPVHVKNCFAEEARVVWSRSGEVFVLNGMGEGYGVRVGPAPTTGG